jgi:hypothetical protein
LYKNKNYNLNSRDFIPMLAVPLQAAGRARIAFLYLAEMALLAGVLEPLDDIEFIKQLLQSLITVEALFAHPGIDVGQINLGNELHKKLAV